MPDAKTHTGDLSIAMSAVTVGVFVFVIAAVIYFCTRPEHRGEPWALWRLFEGCAAGCLALGGVLAFIALIAP